MFEFLRKRCSGQHICILGFGQEGQSSYRVIRKLYPELPIAILDRDSGIAKLSLLEGDTNVTLLSGDEYLDHLDAYSLIFKSPGIALQLLKDIDHQKIVTQTGLFIQQYRKQIIGVTGTKGKSTTSSLIYHILRQYTDDALLVGNIGIPPFDLLDQIGAHTRIVFELSSHQLERLGVSPSMAILLNLFEEHLDHYGNKEDYFLAKMNIGLHQKPGDYFLVHGNDAEIERLLRQLTMKGKLLRFALHESPQSDIYIRGRNLCFRKNEETDTAWPLSKYCKLKGEHNLLNIMAATAACQLSKIPQADIEAGISSFTPLPHRLEWVGCVDGVDYYNDSIATIPEAAIAAIQAIGKVDTLILGGYDRGLHYHALYKFLETSGIRHLVFMGKAGQRMHDEIQSLQALKQIMKFVASDLQEAVAFAKKQTAPTKACLLSPAAASYDAFRNFAERGDAYKALVLS